MNSCEYSWPSTHSFTRPGRRLPRALAVREPKQRVRASPASIPLSASTGASLLQVPVRVEPKTYFANERTFLSWLNMAVLLSSVAVGLIGLGGSDDLATKYARNRRSHVANRVA